jgi:hypothetical protein
MGSHVVFPGNDGAKGLGIVSHGRNDDGLRDGTPRRGPNDTDNVCWNTVEDKILRWHYLDVEVWHHKRGGIYATLLNYRH